jgi:hypothetical protein
MQNERDLDALLDEALATYNDVEPDPSLCTRILARATTQFRRPVRLWTLGAGLATAGALALASFLVHPQPQQSTPKAIDTASSTIAPIAAASSPPVPQASPAIERTRAFRPARHVRTRQRLPKLATFPSPSPLTPDEEALVAFTSQHPGQARHVFAQIAAEKNPLIISPVSIQPIAIASLSRSDPIQSGNSF